ncbi:mevalonate kinase like protein [Penicillium alfredii]|uniref:Mevalonate kinase like protein n=1 Tax=Penicillium alfredii TaxID=1506179 RepID=A0A9W9K804_9EURO|nr:mevalonate kinase like protein [Penicillium alfredii]KAJ5095911.1 mevalonate kinase like protein [Penicillium alfredii]
MDNTHSSAIGPSFMVSAPGKVIVLGEYAAVYGKPVISAAISLRSYLSVKILSKCERTAPNRKLHNLYINSLDKTLLAAIKPYVYLVSLNLPEKERKIYRGSATTFLYLFLSFSSLESPGFVHTLRSTILASAGLGSSASISVCLSTVEYGTTRLNTGYLKAISRLIYRRSRVVIRSY